MKRRLLQYLCGLGLLAEVPKAAPPPRTVLASGVCPLHDDADNPRAFLLFGDGFACTTRHCHKDRRFGNNLFGLVRHLVYRHTGEVMDWRAAWAFASANPDALKGLVQGRVHRARGRTQRRVVTWTRNDLLDCLEVPDPFYLSRGYLPQTLEYFGVGRCVRPLPDGNDRLVGWSIFPVCEGDHRPPLGYTARNPRWRAGVGPNWMHQVRRNEVLYNAANGSGRSPLVICEGPGDVMRWHEAGFPCAVATLGSSLSQRQYFGVLALLDPHREVYVAGDSDDAGRKFVKDACWELRGVCDPVALFPPEGKDFGEMPAERLREWMRQEGRAAAPSRSAWG